MKKDALTVGVIVARFQVPELHQGHLWLMDEVMSRHLKTLLVLGTSGGVRTKKDPLTYEERKRMVVDTYPHATGLNVQPLSDHPFSHELWSQQLDTLIRREYPGMDAVLYGARDSIADPACKYPYTGSFKRELLYSPISMSGTALRQAVEFPHTRDARAALIYAEERRYNYMFSTADLAIWDHASDKVLLTGKHAHSGLLAFMGGHVEKADKNAYDTAVRERSEEIAGVLLGPMRLLGNATIDDPRYRGTNDGVLTNFYMAEYIGGEPKAGDDVDYVAWVHAHELIERLVPWHHELGRMCISYMNEEKRKVGAAL